MATIPRRPSRDDLAIRYRVSERLAQMVCAALDWNIFDYPSSYCTMRRELTLKLLGSGQDLEGNELATELSNAGAFPAHLAPIAAIELAYAERLLTDAIRTAEAEWIAVYRPQEKAS